MRLQNIISTRAQYIQRSAEIVVGLQNLRFALLFSVAVFEDLQYELQRAFHTSQGIKPGRQQRGSLCFAEQNEPLKKTIAQLQTLSLTFKRKILYCLILYSHLNDFHIGCQ